MSLSSSPFAGSDGDRTRSLEIPPRARKNFEFLPPVFLLPQEKKCQPRPKRRNCWDSSSSFSLCCLTVQLSRVSMFLHTAALDRTRNMTTTHIYKIFFPWHQQGGGGGGGQTLSHLLSLFKQHANADLLSLETGTELCLFFAPVPPPSSCLLNQ